MKRSESGLAARGRAAFRTFQASLRAPRVGPIGPGAIDSINSSVVGFAQLVGACLRSGEIQVARIDRAPADHAFDSLVFDFAK